MPARVTKRTALRRKKAASCKRRITMLLKTKSKRVSNSPWNKLVAKVYCEYHSRHPSDHKGLGKAMKLASRVWRSRKAGETMEQMVQRVTY